nr:cytochrome oxidase subunit I [Trypanoplasma borreli]
MIFFVFLTVSHKMIGLLYFLLALIFGFVGYMYSLFIRLELSLCGCGVLFGDYQFYNVIITAHGLIMIFAFVMPIILGGFANYFTPMMCGFPDLIFPRLNNISFWIFFLGGVLLLCGFISEEGMGVGWTLYPTLICYDFHSSLSCDFVVFSVHFLGISSILNSLNLVGTLFVCRRKYFSFVFWVLFIWGLFLTCILLIITLPILAGGVTMIFLDRNFNTSFFDIIGGGDLILFQHLFWFFGHPEVYIIILPIFGLVSTFIDIIGLRGVFSFVTMIYSMLCICVIGFFVWAHHMFVIGMDIDSRAYFGSLSLLIGLPTCIKIFNWFYSFLFYDLLLLIEAYFVVIFIFMFLFGGITGLLLANVGLDVLLHDTYFVVAHFHYVLSLGAVIGVFGGVFHFCWKWIPLEFFVFLVYYNLIVLFLGSNILFYPLHSLGLYSFPRRISDYPINFLLYSFLMLFGVIFLLCLVLFCCCLFSVLLFWDCCFFLCCIFLCCLFSFFCFFIWFPLSCVLYLLLCDFAHIIIDVLFVFLCCFFVFCVYFVCRLLFFV